MWSEPKGSEAGEPAVEKSRYCFVRTRTVNRHRIAAVFANMAQPKTLNRATGIVLVMLGAVIMGVGILK